LAKRVLLGPQQGLKQVLTPNVAVHKCLFSYTPITHFDRLKRSLEKSITALDLNTLKLLHSMFSKKCGLEYISLDREEFARAMGLIGVYDKELLDHAFDIFDADQSGLVDYQEFATGLARLADCPLDEQVAFLFQVWDTDQDGSLTRFEFKQLYVSSQNVRESFVPLLVFLDVWKQLKTDHRDCIGMEETKKGVKLLKKSLAAYNNGSLTFGTHSDGTLREASRGSAGI